MPNSNVFCVFADFLHFFYATASAFYEPLLTDRQHFVDGRPCRGFASLRRRTVPLPNFLIRRHLKLAPQPISRLRLPHGSWAYSQSGSPTMTLPQRRGCHCRSRRSRPIATCLVTHPPGASSFCQDEAREGTARTFFRPNCFNSFHSIMLQVCLTSCPYFGEAEVAPLSRSRNPDASPAGAHSLRRSHRQTNSMRSVTSQRMRVHVAHVWVDYAMRAPFGNDPSRAFSSTSRQPSQRFRQIAVAIPTMHDRPPFR